MKRIVKTQRNYENITRCRFPGVGKYDFPRIAPEKYEECGFIGFNYAIGCPKEKRASTGIHFFLDDYQFQRIWNMPDCYMQMLKQFRYVMTPDFSLYIDFPLTLQLYNHYRKHWIGAYLQQHNVRVIPTISWADEASFEWCFDGEPVGSTVAVSTVGTSKETASRARFLRGYEEMCRRLRPERIIIYGEVPEIIRQRGDNIVRLSSFQEKWRKNNGGQGILQ